MVDQTARRFLIILGIVVLLLLSIFFTGDYRSRYTVIEDVLLAALSPVQGFLSQVGWRTYRFIHVIKDHDRLLEENKMLKEELTARENLRYQLVELQKENFRLREMLEFKERVTYKMLPAQVIARDPSQWFDTITINRGYADGLEKDMAIVTSQGLVGSVNKVSRNSAQVLLLTDSRRAVSALVQRTREPGAVGIVEGYPEEEGYLRMINIPPEAKMQPGDTVISAGLGGIFPKGLIIGHILETGSDQYGLLQQAIVRPAVDFNRLEEVFVVLDPLPVGRSVIEDELL